MAEDKSRKPEDDDDDLDVDDDTEDDDTGGNDPDPRDEALRKANTQAKRWRLRATGKDAGWNAKQGKANQDPPKTTGDGADRDAIEREIREKIEQEYQAKAEDGNLRAAVSTALAGMIALSDDQLASPAATRKAIQRVTNMIDLKSLHMDDDGEIEGLDEEITDLRKSYPGLFKGTGSGNGKTKTRGGDGAARTSSGKQADDDGLAEMAKSWFGRD